MSYGQFDDGGNAYVITDPTPPRPWINYLGNRRLTAFVSQNAGGLMWYLEPHTRRLSRYHYTAAPGDRPGFYLYVKDRASGEVWNPHFAPTCTQLDRFECRHEPGVSSFLGERGGVQVRATYAIPPEDDVMLWDVAVSNVGRETADLTLCTYLEFGILEFMREVIGWCYLKNHFGLRYDRELQAIRYDYHVFEAPFTPAMLFGLTDEACGWECSRDAFIGRTGSLQRPSRLTASRASEGGDGSVFSDSDLPLGGHACAVLGRDLALAPGDAQRFAAVFALADEWPEAEGLLRKYRAAGAVDEGIAEARAFWAQRLSVLRVASGDEAVDRMVNTWGPYNSAVALELCRTISTDHMGTDSLRYRDTTQDAIAVANFDPAFAAERMRMVFRSQTEKGGGCFSFFPFYEREPNDAPRRSDNTVWQIYTVANLLAETGEMGFLDEKIPFREGGEADVYEHILRGLHYIVDRRGPNGLPTLYHADWNDSLALFRDESAESVMLGLQLVHSCREFAVLARRLGRDADAAWCDETADTLSTLLNSELVWDGRWYRRLVLSNGKIIGSAANRQGQIYVNPQSWAVISGVGAQGGRGGLAMDAVAELLDSDFGIRILHPPFKGIPEPEDPPLGSNPGIGENGGIFSHANTWAIIAECMLGNGERAFKYYRQLLPEVCSDKAGADHYEREPYVYVSSIIGPVSERFGEGGISWLTGTANWMQIAATQYIFGIKPTYDGLLVRPCLPACIEQAHVTRRYRGCTYEIEIRNGGGATPSVTIDGQMVDGVLPIGSGRTLQVVCELT